MTNKKILAISPHIDDIELSCGATILKYIQNKNKIYHVVLSDCRNSLKGSKFKPDTNQIQCLEAQKIMSIDEKNVFIHHLPEKFYFKKSRKIFDILEELRQKIHPEIVLIPSPNDTHQDHSTVAKEAISVFRRETSIFVYEQPWNNFEFCPNYFSVVDEQQMNKKIETINKYLTQFYFKRSYFNEDLIRGWARTRGSQVNQKYAEAFEIIKLIGN